MAINFNIYTYPSHSASAVNHFSVLHGLRLMRNQMLAFPESLSYWLGHPYDANGNPCLTQIIIDTVSNSRYTTIPSPYAMELLSAIGRELSIHNGAVYAFLDTPERTAELSLRIDRAIARLEEMEPSAPLPALIAQPLALEPVLA